MLEKRASEKRISGHFEKTKKSPRIELHLVILCLMFSFRSVSANELSSYADGHRGTGDLEKLESEEISVRSDPSVSREKKMQRLREIWQKQRELGAKQLTLGVNGPTKTSEIQKKQTPLTTRSVKYSQEGHTAKKSVKADNTVSNDSLIALSKAIISVLHQRMYVFSTDKHFSEYPISTSKFGIGDEFNSYKTPTGLFRIHSKFGDGLKLGTVFKGRQPTGEVVVPNAKDRDPIVTRIIWLEGLEPSNCHALERCIYIHGTPQEGDLGRPSSFGCVRMASKDVAKVYEMLPEHSRVAILDELDKGSLKKLHYVEEERRIAE